MDRYPQDRLALAAVADWLDQDGMLERGLQIDGIGKVVEELGPAGGALAAELRNLKAAGAEPDDPRFGRLYLAACETRRAARLKPYRHLLRRIVFTKHYDLGGSHYAYTEGQSDAQAERHFVPGSALCVLQLDGLYGRVSTLLEDPTGVIRDPDVSFDAQRVLFAWKKSLDEDDYHLYEITLPGRRVRQLTFGLGYADYEGAYLPDGHIVFNSTRCVQTVDCWWTEVSNLYTCDSRGRYLRRLAFDQIHSNYPTLTPDGRVIYTRWEYNDRGQIYPQGLFQMNPDGTGQRELYGNNSWFPTTILHARAIPNSTKIVCIFTGHHTRQQGWLGLIDPDRGRQENLGARLIAPLRDTPAVRIDKYGQSGDQFQYPYPLNETAFLVAFRRQGERHFGIFFVTIDGRRELLAADPRISCNQPVPLVARPRPFQRSRMPDYRRSTGTLYLHDVYAGPGLAGVERGTIRRLRVVALEFRAAGIGHNTNRGVAGGALASTPVSIEGAWDVKRVLGTARVEDDGSACFEVPAQTPVYFQALDEQGRMVQSMRSWVTLQPGETRSCVGCHEHKNTSPPVTRLSRAARRGPQELDLWQGAPRGFSFAREIQPILDRHCVRCHFVEKPAVGERASRGRPEPPRELLGRSADELGRVSPGSGTAAPRERSTVTVGHGQQVVPAFSLHGTMRLDQQSQRLWSDSYRALADRRVCDWISPQSAPPMLPPNTTGAARSRLIAMLDEGTHYGVKLAPQELNRLVVWIDLAVPYCGDYTEAMPEDKLPLYNRFLEKRRCWEAQEAENIRRLLRDAGPTPRAVAQ